MAVNLTPDQIENLQKALLSAFDRGDLRQLSYYALNEAYESVVGQGSLREQVYDLITYANKQRKVEELLKKARERNPGNELLKAVAEEILSGAPPKQVAVSQENPVTLPSPSEDIKKVMEALIIGQPDSRVSLMFIEGALRVARSIARIKVPRVRNGMPDGGEFAGTGWLIAPGLLLTNYHVIEARDRTPGQAEPRATKADFDAQAGYATFEFERIGETSSSSAPLKLLSAKVLSADYDLDYTLLELDEARKISDRKTLKILPKLPPLTQGSRINIIQYPAGRPLLFGIRNNFYVDSVPGKPYIQYQTSTEPGASGSPVCDDDWNVIAIHHAASPAQPRRIVVEGVPGQTVITTVLNEAVVLPPILAHLSADLRKRILDAQEGL